MNWYALIILYLALINLNSCLATPFPPINASWVRSNKNPMLIPTEPWEETCVCEPQVYWDSYETEFRMYYRGGWGNQSVGVATSKDGIQWVKYEHNPVYGHGGSNVTGLQEGGQPFVFRESVHRYWLYTTRQQWNVSKWIAHLNIAISEDGYLWTPLESKVTLPTNCTLWGNRVVWTEQDNMNDERHVLTLKTNWYMLQEAACGVWNIFLYTSTDGFTWHIGNNGNALSTLQMGVGGGMYGGPSFANINGTITPKNASGVYNLWYHASPAGKGNLPTDIYHAASRDLISWKISLNETPVFEHSGIGPEYDQVADPSPIIAPDGRALLYYDADNNVNGTSSIELACESHSQPQTEYFDEYFSVYIELL